MKLKNAAQITAYCGRNTRVETTVAMELAASCRPFNKSKISAMAMSEERANKLSELSIGSANLRRYTFSITIALISFATSSNRSMTASRWS
jgi:hypothetical protein